VLATGTDRNIIKGNTIVNSAGNGIRLDGGEVDTSDDNQILDNTIISSGFNGIILFGKRVVIQGNTIDQSVRSGFKIDTFVDSDLTLISKDAIIKDNSITNSGEFGIAIESGSLNTVVIDNTLAGNGNGDNLLNNGSDTVLAGNVPNLM